MPPAIKRIGVLTGGGDAPGLNAVIRAVVKSCRHRRSRVRRPRRQLRRPDLSRTVARPDAEGRHRHPAHRRHDSRHDQPGNPFVYPIETADGPVDYSDRVIENFKKMGLDALVVIGGDGTLSIAHEFHKRGIPIVGVPKTIDNDIAETTMTFGFDTAVAFATDALDRLHTTAESHHRIMVAEVMGRYAGWIALYAGIGGGADVVLIPEIPFRFDRGRRADPGARRVTAPGSASSSWPRAPMRWVASARSSPPAPPIGPNGSAGSASTFPGNSSA